MYYQMFDISFLYFHVGGIAATHLGFHLLTHSEPYKFEFEIDDFTPFGDLSFYDRRGSVVSQNEQGGSVCNQPLHQKQIITCAG